MFSFSEYLIKMYIIKAALAIPEPKINKKKHQKTISLPNYRRRD